MRRSLVEQETIVRFDRSEPILHLWTASRAVFLKLTRRGWTLTPSGGGWSGKAPLKALTWRALPLRPRGPRRIT
jgi:hypothetical protein